MAASHEDRNAQLSPGVAIKAPCRAATTAAITLSGEQTIDAVACVSGDRVLVKNQTAQTANGIYLVSTGAWTREPDFDGTRDVVLGTFVFITNGAVNAGAFYECTTTGTIVFGTSNITFAQGALGPIALPLNLSNTTFTQSGTGATARTGLDKTRDLISVKDFGAVGDGVTDDTAAIQAASDAVLLAGGGTLYFPFGTYKITATLNFFKTGSALSIRYVGASCLGTVLSWSGATNSTAVKIQRLVRFKVADLSIVNAVAAGTTVGLNVTAEAASGSDTGPSVFESVRISGFNKNYVVGASGSGKAASEFTYINFEIANAATTGAELNGANSLDHTFIQLVLNANATGMEVVDPDTIHILGGSSSGSTVQDFAFRPAGAYSIRKFRSETANRFCTIGPDSPAGAGSPTNLTIENVRIATTSAADLRAIRLNKAVQVRIIGSEIQQGHIYFDTGLDVSSSVTIEDNIVVDSSLYEIGAVQQSRYIEVLARGNRKSASSGNQFWDDEHFILNLSTKLLLNTVDLSTITAPKQYVSQVLGLSSTSTPAKNLRGQATFASAATKAVAFVTNEPDATYFVALSGNVNETFWVTAKAVGGFTLNSSNATSTAVVDWHLIR